MSKMGQLYYDLCEADDFAEEQEQQANDPDYELISIDYSQQSWEQFTADLNNPSSKLREDLAIILAEGDLR